MKSDAIDAIRKRDQCLMSWETKEPGTAMGPSDRKIHTLLAETDRLTAEVEAWKRGEPCGMECEALDTWMRFAERNMRLFLAANGAKRHEQKCLRVLGESRNRLAEEVRQLKAENQNYYDTEEYANRMHRTLCRLSKRVTALKAEVEQRQCDAYARDSSLSSLTSVLKEMKVDRDAMREALEKLSGMGGVGSLYGGDDMQIVARDCLARIKGKV